MIAADEFTDDLVLICGTIIACVIVLALAAVAIWQQPRLRPSVPQEPMWESESTVTKFEPRAVPNEDDDDRR
jgi:hypothetical protein